MSAIACDIDGVLANFVKGFTTLVHDLDPTIPVVEDPNVSTWDCHQWWGEWSHPLSPVVEEAWTRIKSTNNWGFWLNLEPIGDLSPVISCYRDVPIVFMTRRDGGLAHRQTWLWLEKYGVKEPLVYRVHSGEEKHEICAKLGISIIIEDAPKVAQKCLDAGMKVVMPGYDYNDLLWHQRLYRVFGLDAAVNVARIQEGYK